MILSGEQAATLLSIQPVSLHGTAMFDVIYSHNDEPQQQRRARLGQESVYTNPQVGDAVLVSYLLNTPTGIKKA